MSFCVNPAKFNPNQYYRDSLARTLLETCGENPVPATHRQAGADPHGAVHVSRFARRRLGSTGRSRLHPWGVPVLFTRPCTQALRCPKNPSHLRSSPG